MNELEAELLLRESAADQRAQPVRGLALESYVLVLEKRRESIRRRVQQLVVESETGMRVEGLRELRGDDVVLYHLASLGARDLNKGDFGVLCRARCDELEAVRILKAMHKLATS